MLKKKNVACVGNFLLDLFIYAVCRFFTIFYCVILLGDSLGKKVFTIKSRIDFILMNSHLFYGLGFR